MSAALFERRRSLAVRFAIAAFAACTIAFVTTSIDRQAGRTQATQELMAPGLAQSLSRAHRIVVTAPGLTLRIERGARGGWSMPDRGDYPVSDARVGRIVQALTEMTLARRMTSDAARHERLGVGDPRERGDGLLVQIEDANGALLFNRIFGIEPQAVYVRTPGDNAVWAIGGALPSMREPSSWLELRPITVEEPRVARVAFMLADGASVLERRASTQGADFAVSAPARLVLPPAVANEAALRLLRMAPVDVQAAPAVQGAARGHVRLTTFDGVVVDGELVELEGRVWLKISASAENDAARPRAAALNEAHAGWAYALSAADAAALLTPLSALVAPPPGSGPPLQP